MSVPGDMRVRLLAAGGLAAAALVLGLALVLGGGGGHSPPPPEDAAQGIDRAVRELLTEYGVPEAAVRTRKVKTPGAGFARVERRATVPGDFVTPAFNKDLNGRVARFDGRSFATERTRENTVSVHVLAGHTVVQTVQFQLDPFARRDTTAPPAGR